MSLEMPLSVHGRWGIGIGARSWYMVRLLSSLGLSLSDAITVTRCNSSFIGCQERAAPSIRPSPWVAWKVLQNDDLDPASHLLGVHPVEHGFTAALGRPGVRAQDVLVDVRAPARGIREPDVAVADLGRARDQVLLPR